MCPSNKPAVKAARGGGSWFHLRIIIKGVGGEGEGVEGCERAVAFCVLQISPRLRPRRAADRGFCLSILIEGVGSGRRGWKGVKGRWRFVSFK